MPYIPLSSTPCILNTILQALSPISFTDDLWLENAAHANRMAQLLAEQIKGIPDLAIIQPVQANAIFASLPRVAIDRLLKKYFFYIWNEERNEVRWMTSFATSEEDIAKFAAAISESCR